MNKSVLSAILGPYALAMLMRRKGAKNNPLQEMIGSITQNPKGLVVTVNVQYIPTRDLSWCDPEWDDCEDADDYGWITMEVAELPSNLESGLDFFKKVVEHGRTLGPDEYLYDFARETLWDYDAPAVLQNMDFDNFTAEGMVIPDYIDRRMIPNEENTSTVVDSTDERKVHSIEFKVIFKSDPELMGASRTEIYSSIYEIVNIAFYMTGDFYDSEELRHDLGRVVSVFVQTPEGVRLPLSDSLRTSVRRF